jgi:hydroxypyruvate reductase
MAIEDPASFLRSLFETAVAAADPARRVPPHLPTPPKGRTVVVGAGKASAAMARAVEDHWMGPLEGIIVTRYGHGAPCRKIEIVEAAHPVPDASGRAAALRIAEKVSGLSADDLVLCLLSGGGSALLAAPAPGLALEDKQEINRQLLACGAPIAEMNCVRKHLSALKGGRLALRAHPARVVSLIISDVPGDDPATVASGPTLPDPTTREQALAIMEKYRIRLAAHVRRFLESPEAETPKPGDPRLERAGAVIVATSSRSLAAAARQAEKEGLRIINLGDRIEGEARVVAQTHVTLALETSPPALILSGGETTVTLRGSGRGGRNTEYLLALALAFDGRRGCWAIACDTDGVDGSEANAGAFLFPDALARARKLGIDGGTALAENDAYSFFERLGALIVTGPTRTNVNDFRAILVA